MAEFLKDKASGRRVSIAEAHELSKSASVLIWWRPEQNLEEAEQYALVYGE